MVMVETRVSPNCALSESYWHVALKEYFLHLIDYLSEKHSMVSIFAKIGNV